MMRQIKSAGARLPGYWEAPLYVTGVFMMFILARYMQWGARRDIFKTLRIEFLLGLILTVVCTLLLTSNPVRLEKLKDAKNVLIGIVLLFAVMVIQIPFAADKDLASKIFVDRVIKFAMLTYFMVVLIRSPRSMRYFIGAFLFACFYVTQEAARGALNGGLIWENQGIMRLHGAVPIYAHPNSLGGVAIGLVPFVVFILPTLRRWKVRLLLLPPLGTAFICMLYSGSRTTYVGFIGFMLFWWLQSERKGRWLLIMVVLSLVALPLIPAQYKERFQSIGGQEAEGNSKETRIEILQDATTIFLTHPGGVGIASFPAVRMQVFGRKQDTHNLYLEVATNLGVQGFIVFVLLIVFMLRALYLARNRLREQERALRRAIKKSVSRDKRLFGRADGHLADLCFLRAVAQAAGGFIFVRLALGLFGMDLYEVYWWFAAGIAFSVSLLETDTRRRTRALLQALDPASS